MPRENPFSVPGDYFQDFNARLDDRIRKESRPVVRFSRNYRLAAAALALLITIGSVVIYRQQHPSVTAEPSILTVSVQDLDESGLVDRIAEYTLMELFPESNIDLLEGDILSEPDGITDDEIEQYLLQSNEIESLIENM
jgi:hypothetical protein